MRKEESVVAKLLVAMKFAAEKHAHQRRKNAEGFPYINHLIEVAELVATAGAIDDETTLLAAVLHDTLEDTATTREELDQLFGVEVRKVVEEVTDDKKLEKQVRKRLQIEHAPFLSVKARSIKIADKISNVRAVTHTPPASWSHARKVEYLRWTEEVLKNIVEPNEGLMALYRTTLAEGMRMLRAENSNPQMPNPT